ncbi:hypothetical protein BCR42DRAFT_213111 [Absidia repens]|uniref:Uncharacterized protein n=1 Tax=Absidia repens TaxID=90262 RepID=A0A1X2IR60_9FUNG|nr:hypothetical protein BCR42DRAFT_213111 [Absidia repens]
MGQGFKILSHGMGSVWYNGVGQNAILTRQQMSFYLLKQVRSEFNHLSTYTLCRSLTTIT